MSGSVNMVFLIGNVTADPDIRRTQGGLPIANFTVATNETWKDKNTGEKKERAEFHRCVCFNEGLCRVIENYVRKGSRIHVLGKLQTRKWQDKDGNDRWTTEVVLQGYGASLVLLGDGGGKREDRAAGEDAARDAEAREAELSGFDDQSIPF